MDTLQVPVTDSLKDFLVNQATKKGFSSPGDYVQSLLSDLQERETTRADLEEKLREGLRSPSIEVSATFWQQLRAEFLTEHPELKSCDD